MPLDLFRMPAYTLMAPLLLIEQGLDPQPPRCPDHRSSGNYRTGCQPCKEWNRWRHRHRRRLSRYRVAQTYTDVPRVHAHLDRLLREGGLILADIARISGVDAQSIADVLRGRRTLLYPRTALALLRVPMPESRQVRKVNAIGLRRRTGAMCRAGHSVATQSEALGWEESSLFHWMTRDTVTLQVHEDVKTLYGRLRDVPGVSRLSAARARTKGYPPARYFDDTNIDDPAYDPMAPLPPARAVGVWRRLRSLAVLGQGPEQVGALIDEPAADVEKWMLKGKTPVYAAVLVRAAYEKLSAIDGGGTPGPDQRLADLARHEDWPSPLAWNDEDLDNYRAQPKRSATKSTDNILTSVVYEAVDGKIPAADLTHAERVVVVTLLHRRGWTARRIAAWLRWNPDGNLEQGLAAVNAFLVREDIRGYGAAVYGGSADTGADQILEGAAA